MSARARTDGLLAEEKRFLTKRWIIDLEQPEWDDWTRS